MAIERIAYIGGYQIDMDEFGGKTITENEKEVVPIFIFMRDHHLESHITHYLGEWTEESGERLASELLADNKTSYPGDSHRSDPIAFGVYKS